MNGPMTSEELVNKWIANAKAGKNSPEHLFEAWETVNETVSEDPEAGWGLILGLVEAAPDDQVLADIAAGPLEDLIEKWSATLIDRIEIQARRDPKFRRCLTGVWFSSQVPHEVSDQIRKYTSTVADPL